MEHRLLGGSHLLHRSNSRPSYCNRLSLSFSLLLLLLSLFSSSPLYASAAKSSYLLNCGTSTATVVDGRNFVPDSSSTGFFDRNGSPVPVNNPNPTPGASVLYSTASVFTNVTTYKFGISDPGTQFVRLHFSPFSAGGFNLASASFQVTAMDGSLLLLATLPSKFPLIKEYLLWHPSGQLSIAFIPAQGSYAYVNAIEVFTSPDGYMNSTNPTLIGSPAIKGTWGQQLMENVHRVNAGAPQSVSYANDTLYRTWVNDQSFLFIKNTAVSNSSSLPIQYPKNGPPTRDFAPDVVYATAEVMNLGPMSPGALFNITWDFPVPSGYNYLLRMHFCDFISSSVDALYFNVYVNNRSGTPDLHPAEKTNRVAVAPFYMDYATDVIDSGGVLRVSVGPSTKTSDSSRNAILNGIEIWKVSNSAGSLDGPFNGNGGGGGSGGSSSSSSNTVVIAAVAAAVVVILILAGIAVFYIRRRRNKTVQSQEQAPSEKSQQTAGSRMTRDGSLYTNIVGPGNGNSLTVTNTNSEGRSVASSMVNFNLHIPLTELAEATNGFDEDLVIGAGGFGKVYKGMLRDGTHVAAKRASLSSKQGLREFQNEIMLLSQIRHRHLVSLIGFSNEHDEMILVYEYMEKGTLKDLLYGPHKVHLNWKQRLEICIGSARGLHYLHTGFTHSIIHRDIKSSNILLGTNFIAKVSDFGLSRVNESVDQTHVSTAVKGSFGYLDPEYFKTQKLTDKSDVYSFGVLLFEVLCARPALDQSAPRDQLNLAEWATDCYRKESLEEIVDPDLRGDIDPNSLKKFVETAVKCLAEYGSDRPAIGDVLWSLEYVMQLHATGGVGQRGPFEDSVNSESQLPTVVRPILPPQGRFGEGGSDDSDVTSSNVFSQLITGEGR